MHPEKSRKSGVKKTNQSKKEKFMKNLREQIAIEKSEGKTKM